jgi:hypothetical protein
MIQSLSVTASCWKVILATYGFVDVRINAGCDGAFSWCFAHRWRSVVLTARWWNCIVNLNWREGQVKQASLLVDVVVFSVWPIRRSIDAAALEVHLNRVDDFGTRLDDFVFGIQCVLEVWLDKCLEFVTVLISPDAGSDLSCEHNEHAAEELKQQISQIVNLAVSRIVVILITHRYEHALWLLESAAASAECQKHHQDTETEEDEQSILVVLLFLSKWDHKCWINQHPDCQCDDRNSCNL